MKNEELLKEIKRRWDIATQADEKTYADAADDVRFRIPGNQWPDAIKLEREGRPCMEFDRTGAFCRQIVNEIRQSKPSIMVSPVGDGADQETAEVIQGLIRHIEYASNADIAYDRAADSMVTGGFGFYRIITEYIDENSFDQEIRIVSIPNQFMVHIDPASVEPDGSDMQYAFVASDYSAEEFKREFPNADLASYNNDQWQTIADECPDWVTTSNDREGQGCRVVEYWYKDYKDDVLLMFDNGSTELKSAYKGTEKAIKKRNVNICTVKCVKTNGVEILAEQDWAGKWIPIFPVYGNESYIDGERHRFGLVRLIKDVARLHNYMRSAEVEAIALAPKAPWVGPLGFRGAREQQWNDANRKNYSTLEYEYKDEDGNPMPPPVRQFPEPATQAISQAIQGTDIEFKAITGLYDASLGNRQSDQSGVAIRQLQNQGQTSNFHYIDNCSRTRRHLGRSLVDVAPKIYDTARIVRIIGEDGNEKQTMINALDPETGAFYRFDTGRYDVTISSGPSYATKRQENLSMMMEMAKTMPIIGQVMPDMIMGQVDAPFAKKAAERLKKTLPPGIADDPQDKNAQAQPQIPPQLQQDIQMMMQQQQQLQQALQAAQAQIESKNLEYQVQLEKARMDNETRLQVAELNGKYELEKIVLQNGAKIHELSHSAAVKVNPALAQELAREASGIAEAPELEQAEEPIEAPEGGVE